MIGSEKIVLNLPINQIITDYKSGISGNKIANKYNCNPTTIIRRLRENGVIIRSSSEMNTINLSIQSICEDYQNGMNIDNISKKYNCSKSVIRERLHDNVIMRQGGITKDIINISIYDICDDYQNGLAINKIAKKYKHGLKTITNILYNNGIIIKSSGKNGELILNLPINEICNKFNNGMSIHEIAKEYKCSKTAISKRLHDSGINVLEESGKHRSATIQGIQYDKWRTHITIQTYCSLFSEEFKEQIRNLYNRKCFMCGKSELENNRKLSVHHVNYDKKCLCRTICEFVPLCGSCHAKTNTNRKYWEDLIMCYLYPERYFMIDL